MDPPVLTGPLQCIFSQTQIFWNIHFDSFDHSVKKLMFSVFFIWSTYKGSIGHFFRSSWPALARVNLYFCFQKISWTFSFIFSFIIFCLQPYHKRGDLGNKSNTDKELVSFLHKQPGSEKLTLISRLLLWKDGQTPASIRSPHLANFRVLLKLLGGSVALDEVDVSLKTSA